MNFLARASFLVFALFLTFLFLTFLFLLSYFQNGPFFFLLLNL